MTNRLIRRISTLFIENIYLTVENIPKIQKYLLKHRRGRWHWASKEIGTLAWDEIPKSPGHAFYDRLQAILARAGFDRFVEGLCESFYASRKGRPSIPPGSYFRMHLVGYFEGIDSERGIEWRCADSLSLREFLLLAKDSGMKTPSNEDLSRMDRKRKGKKLSNRDWESPVDPDAKIARMKDGRTRLAYKPEHVVDLDTGAVVGVEWDSLTGDLVLAVGLKSDTASQNPEVSAVQVTVEGQVADMVLAMDAIDTTDAPDTARIFGVLKDVDALTLNTDLKGWASRHGGSNWDQITLAQVSGFGSDKYTFEGDLSAYTHADGGSDEAVFKITSHNNKDFELHFLSEGVTV